MFAYKVHKELVISQGAVNGKVVLIFFLKKMEDTKLLKMCIEKC